ncbi:hypothetical protein [Profundibacter sp.]
MSRKAAKMDISEHLDAINKAFDSVRIAAFADLSVQLVLADSTKSEIGQELLDDLCIKAANVFECPALSVDNSLIDPPVEAIIMTDKGILLTLRSTEFSPNALIFECDYNINLKDILEMARNTLKKIGVE